MESQLPPQNGYGPLQMVMEYKDQQWLELLLLEIKKHMEKMFDNNTTIELIDKETLQLPLLHFITPYYESIKGYKKKIWPKSKGGYNQLGNSIFPGE